MKRSTSSLLAAALSALSVSAAADLTLSDIGATMAALPCLSDTCTYSVLLPSLSDPVTYRVTLDACPAPEDSLSPCSYIIEWSMPTPSGVSQGFSAYFPGEHYRFRDGRLQEYHITTDADAFAPMGDVERGVQRQVQFADLIPQNIGRAFQSMAADSSYIYNIIIRPGRVVVSGVRRFAGFDAAECTYTLDAATLRPISIELENNPGQLGEQSITVRYASGAAPAPLDIDALMTRHPVEFERFRESTFTLDNLPGRRLPDMSAPTLGGQRYIHHSGQGVGVPTIIAFVDSSVDSTPAVIAALREATAYLPMQSATILAFTDHRADDVAPLVGSPQPGETVLLHASAAASACGVGAITPVIIFVDSDGTVKDFCRGVNKDLTSVVIQKTSLCR